MNHSFLIEAFDRGKDAARTAMSADEVVEIIQDLENLTLDYIGQPKPVRPGQPEPKVVVTKNTSWG